MSAQVYQIETFFWYAYKIISILLVFGLFIYASGLGSHLIYGLFDDFDEKAIIREMKMKYNLEKDRSEYLDINEPDMEETDYNKLVDNPNDDDLYSLHFGKIKSLPLKKEDVTCSFGDNGTALVSINNTYHLKLQQNRKLFSTIFQVQLKYYTSNGMLRTKSYKPNLHNFFVGHVINRSEPNWVNMYVDKDCDIMGTVHLEDEEFTIHPGYYYTRIYRNISSNILAKTEAKGIPVFRHQFLRYSQTSRKPDPGLDPDLIKTANINKPVCTVAVNAHHSMLYGPLGRHGNEIHHTFRYMSLMVAEASKILEDLIIPAFKNTIKGRDKTERKKPEVHKNETQEVEYEEREVDDEQEIPDEKSEDEDKERKKPPPFFKGLFLSIDEMVIYLNGNNDSIYNLRSAKELQVVNVKNQTGTIDYSQYRKNVENYLAEFNATTSGGVGIKDFFLNHVLSKERKATDAIQGDLLRMPKFSKLDKLKWTTDTEREGYKHEDDWNCLRIMFTSDNFFKNVIDRQKIAYSNQRSVCAETHGLNTILTKITTIHPPPPLPLVRPIQALERLERLDIVYTWLANHIASSFGLGHDCFGLKKQMTRGRGDQKKEVNEKFITNRYIRKHMSRFVHGSEELELLQSECFIEFIEEKKSIWDIMLE
ncbi:hypothetical protein QYM36_008825 [Artemia franciscana]|uniref:Uncharacterized protein n=1 Tax=Artemia franciscana TaxID=6661 RepID=A0AA88L0G5_ARTSF|nr:hypothetical protein QYM36_008825 [Artemia franciscana]